MIYFYPPSFPCLLLQRITRILLYSADLNTEESKILCRDGWRERQGPSFSLSLSFFFFFIAFLIFPFLSLFFLFVFLFPLIGRKKKKRDLDTSDSLSPSPYSLGFLRFRLLYPFGKVVFGTGFWFRFSLEVGRCESEREWGFSEVLSHLPRSKDWIPLLVHTSPYPSKPGCGRLRCCGRSSDPPDFGSRANRCRPVSA